MALRPVEVDADGAGRWQRRVDVGPGPGTLEVTVLRAGIPAATIRTPWTVPDAAPPPRRLVSDRPLRPVTTGLAGVVLAVTVLALLAGLPAARRRRRSATAQVDSAVTTGRPARVRVPS